MAEEEAISPFGSFGDFEALRKLSVQASRLLPLDNAGIPWEEWQRYLADRVPANLEILELDDCGYFDKLSVSPERPCKIPLMGLVAKKRSMGLAIRALRLRGKEGRGAMQVFDGPLMGKLELKRFLKRCEERRVECDLEAFEWAENDEDDDEFVDQPREYKGESGGESEGEVSDELEMVDERQLLETHGSTAMASNAKELHTSSLSQKQASNSHDDLPIGDSEPPATNNTILRSIESQDEAHA